MVSVTVKKTNCLGLRNMLGNAYEWISDSDAPRGAGYKADTAIRSFAGSASPASRGAQSRFNKGSATTGFRLVIRSEIYSPLVGKPYGLDITETMPDEDILLTPQPLLKPIVEVSPQPDVNVLAAGSSPSPAAQKTSAPLSSDKQAAEQGMQRHNINWLAAMNADRVSIKMLPRRSSGTGKLRNGDMPRHNKSWNPAMQAV